MQHVSLPCAIRTIPVTINMTIAIILAAVKTICILAAHLTLAQLTNVIITVRNKIDD